MKGRSMQVHRRRRQSRAVVLCCAAAPFTSALNFPRTPSRSPHGQARSSRFAMHHNTLMDPTVPQAGYSVQREQTLSLFWTERINDPVHGLSGCVRTAARDELHAPRTVATGVDPNCLAVDSLKRTVYWSDRSKGAITRSSVDCDNFQAEFIAEGYFGHRHLDGPWGLG